MFDRSSIVARLKQRSKAFWIMAALVLFLVLIFAASAGFAGVLIILGILTVIAGLYYLIFKRATFRPKAAALVAGAGVVAIFMGGIVAGATAAPEKAALVATTPSATATPTASSPANSPCLTAGQTRTYRDKLFICTMGSYERLVWLNEEESKRVTAQAAAQKAAADKIIADKLAADKAAADKEAADKAAADKAAAEAARPAAPAPAPARPAAPAPVAPKAPASAYYANCAAAKAAGAAPVRVGQPGYGRHLDRDGDGVGCES
jgi:lysylphosphatidylglycerol synthetase-like protein (DUF2156 family)